MSVNTLNHHDIDQKIRGIWHHLSTDYLWDFRQESDGQWKLTVVNKSKLLPTVQYVDFRTIVGAEGDIFIELQAITEVSRHRVIFLNERVMQFYDVSFDEVQEGIVTLNKI